MTATAPPTPPTHPTAPLLRPAVTKRPTTTRKRRTSTKQLVDPLQLLTLVVTSAPNPAAAIAAASDAARPVTTTPVHPGGKSTSKLLCTLCASTFGRRCELKRHIAEVHTANGARRFGCTHPSCCKSFTRKDALVKHHAVKHQGKRRFVCSTCRESFTSRYDLSRHTVRVHSNVKKRFTCEFCAAGFSQKSQLTMHKGRVHAPSTPSKGSLTAKDAPPSPISTCASYSTSASTTCGTTTPATPRDKKCPSPIDSLAAVAVALAAQDEAMSDASPAGVREREVEAATYAAHTLLKAAEVLQPSMEERKSTDDVDEKEAAEKSTELPTALAMEESMAADNDSNVGISPNVLSMETDKKDDGIAQSDKA